MLYSVGIPTRSFLVRGEVREAIRKRVASDRLVGSLESLAFVASVVLR